MIRVTTNSSLRNYKSNLMNSTNTMYTAMTKVMTQRSFNTYADNPAYATRTFQLHSSLNATNAQYSNSNTVKGKLDTAWSTMDTINDILNDNGQIPTLSGLNDTNLDALNTLGGDIRQGAESIVNALNARYGNNFIFGGADTKNAPFAIETDTDANGYTVSYLTYRGIRVDDPTGITTDENGDPLYTHDDGTAMTNQEVLEMFDEEHLYVDVGLGFSLDANGEVLPSTAIDSAVSGIGVMGYGVDDEGDPMNVVSLMLKAADMFEAYDHDTKTWGIGSKDEAIELVGKFEESRERFVDEWTEIDARSGFLEKNSARLELNFDALNEERSSLEDVDMADAITELVWAQTCYNAALQVGTNIIPQSLMDYMN